MDVESANLRSTLLKMLETPRVFYDTIVWILEEVKFTKDLADQAGKSKDSQISTLEELVKAAHSKRTEMTEQLNDARKLKGKDSNLQLLAKFKILLEVVAFCLDAHSKQYRILRVLIIYYHFRPSSDREK